MAFYLAVNRSNGVRGSKLVLKSLKEYVWLDVSLCGGEGDFFFKCLVSIVEYSYFSAEQAGTISYFTGKESWKSSAAAGI